MNFLWYIHFFHDGSINNIEHVKNDLKFLMNSAEMLPKDNPENVNLNKDNRLCGVLLIKNIKSITINGVDFFDQLAMIRDSADILDFDLTGHGVKLGIYWMNYPPKASSDYFSTILIESDEVFWEDKMNQIRINLSDLKSI